MKKVTSRDGTKIAYDAVGQGPVIILVLGALNSRKSGVKLAKLLASGFTVINYDRRGRGDSTDTAPYAPQREIEDVSALIDATGAPVCLYGHSSGAAIVLEAALKLRKKVQKLAIYEPPYSLGGAASKASVAYSKQLKGLLASRRNGDAVELFIRNVGVSDKQIRALKRMPMWGGLEALAPTLAYDSAVLGDGQSLPRSRLARITTPALVMHGGKGTPAMREAAEAISESIPKATLRTLVGQTHGVSARVLSPVLAKFFAAK